MRQLCSMPSESDARTFSDYLYVTGIENKYEAAGTGEPREPAWVIWIYDENRLDEAKSLLSEFLSNPADPKFHKASVTADDSRRKEQQELKAYRKRIFTGTQIFPRYDRMGKVTIIMMVISILVAVVSRLGQDHTFTRYLFITEFMGGGLIEVRLGQVWRLVTPIFIHFGILHILFNLLWLRDLGSMIESRQSSLTLAGMVLFIAVFSNMGQYIMSGPMFGGMSGVIYGLLGYVWIRGKYDPSSGLFVHPQTVMMMGIWFVVCLTGLLGNVANTAHGVGLATGAAWGFMSSKLAIRR